MMVGRHAASDFEQQLTRVARTLHPRRQVLGTEEDAQVSQPDRGGNRENHGGNHSRHHAQAEQDQGGDQIHEGRDGLHEIQDGMQEFVDPGSMRGGDADGTPNSTHVS